jgi:hypothetical protein
MRVCVCVCVCSSRYIQNAQLMVSACSVLFQQHHGSRQCLFNRRTTLFSGGFSSYLFRKEKTIVLSLYGKGEATQQVRCGQTTTILLLLLLLLLLPIPLYWVRLTAWFWIFYFFKKKHDGVLCSQAGMYRKKKPHEFQRPTDRWWAYFP